MVETINGWLPIVGALCGGLLFIWRITYNLNKTLVILSGNIKDLNETTKNSKKQIDNHEVRIVVLETVTGIKSYKKEGKSYEN